MYTREAALQVDHAFRRWLIATARVTFAVDDYVGSDRVDDRYAISTALTYKLTREVALKAELRRDWRTSNVPGNEYTSYSALVGMRLQRVTAHPRPHSFASIRLSSTRNAGPRSSRASA